MGDSSVPKQFLLAYSKPIIVHTIEHFERCSQIDGIVVVCLENYIDYMLRLKEEYGLTKIVSVVPGGPTGQASIDNDDIVLVHDGVRPLIDEKLIADNIACVKANGNSVTVANAAETVVLLGGDVVDKVMDRKFCRLAKAPQCFYLKDIYAAHLRAAAEGIDDFIDSAVLMQHYGAKIHTVNCSTLNLKITTPTDYYLFKAILDARESEQIKLL